MPAAPSVCPKHACVHIQCFYDRLAYQVSRRQEAQIASVLTQA